MRIGLKGCGVVKMAGGAGSVACRVMATVSPVLTSQPRARDLGIPFNGTPGRYKAITDVAGVAVGFSPLIAGLPPRKAVRTGVTAILPRGRDTLDHPVFAGIFSLNGNGAIRADRPGSGCRPGRRS